MALGSINQILLTHWNNLSEKLKGDTPNPEISGSSLDLATVIDIARYVRIQLHEVS